MTSTVVKELPAFDPKNQCRLFTITHRTKDYGERFVVREHRVMLTGGPDHGTILVGATPVAVADDLEAARRSIPRGLYNVGRDVADDPVIVESWI